MPVLGLIFLRYAYSRFKLVEQEILKDRPMRGGRVLPVEQSDFAEKSALFLPKEAQYNYLVNLPANIPEQGLTGIEGNPLNSLGEVVNNAMELVEQQSEQLQGVLPKDYTIFSDELLGELLRIFCGVNEDKEGLVQRYIELDSPNMNYLTVIMQEENPDKLKLSEMTRFKAYKKLEIMRKKLFETGLSFRTGVGIGFKPMDGTGKIENESEDQNELKVSYDSKWILDNLDYATLLNNFYWFEFADFFNRCLLVSQPSEYGLENFLFGTRGLREYQVGTSFRIKNTMAFLQMTGYYNILCQREIEIEDIYKWFFETYLKDEFNVEGFVYEKVRRDAPFGERNRLISSKIDHVLKQFDLYSKYGAIDRDYLEFSSQSVEFSQVASLSTQKYAYCNDENIRSEYISIFSSQSLLTYVERIGKAYDSFFKLLENETVYYNDFKTIQKEKIDFLLSQGTIRIDEAGEIELKYDRLRMLIQLYRYEYLCLAYEKTENDPLKDALKNNKLLVENTLFSRPEQDYLDYLLNKHKFSNGLDLRNKYIHSTNSLDEKVHRDDYMRFLIVMAIIIIKINEEFCLKEKLKK